MMGFIDPQFVCHEAPSLPYGGAWHGPEGLSDLLAAAFSAYEMLAVDVEEVLDAGGETVIGVLQVRAHAEGLRPEGRDAARRDLATARRQGGRATCLLLGHGATPPGGPERSYSLTVRRA